MTLASIVEREAKQPAERADHRQRVPEPHGRGHAPAGRSDGAVRGGDRATAPRPRATTTGADLTPADLEIDSPYNTYADDGSAARPDLQPGRSLDPRRAAARPDGLPVLRGQTRRQRHAPVRQTLDEHNANVAKVNGPSRLVNDIMPCSLPHAVERVISVLRVGRLTAEDLTEVLQNTPCLHLSR